MSIEITKVKLLTVGIDNKDEPKIQGNYALMDSNNKIIAKQSFNGYDDMKFDFDYSFLKNIIEDIEAKIERDLGVAVAVKMIKEDK